MTPPLNSFRWDDIFNAIGHPAIILDRDHRVIAANSASIRLTALPREEIIGKYCYEVFHRHSGNAPLEGCPMEKMLRSGSMESTDMEIEALDGIFMVSCTPILDENGMLDKVIHIATDITERKRTENALAEQQYFTDSLISNSTIATFVLDLEHKVVVWNKACAELTGFASADMLGSSNQWQAFYDRKQPTLADVLLDGDFARLPKLYSHVGRISHNRSGYKAEGWFANISGKDRYFLVEAAPIYNSKSQIISVIETIYDLTESKTLEEQLLHSQKMESIGHLAGGIAHEFNNILAVILGYGQVMRKSLAAGSTMAGDLEQILEAGDRASQLTKGLLAFSRKQHVSMKNLDLNQLVHSTLKSFTRIIGDDIEFSENLESVPLIIHADQAQLVQVLMNLIANARDAMPQGGNLLVCTRQAVVTEALTTPFCTVPPGSYAKITVSDNGHGFDSDEAHKIFEPFYTTKDIGKGTGLGLAVVYGIVSQHGGYICVDSAIGQGTVIDIYFTLMENSATKPMENLSAELKGGNETILLADDEATLLILFSDILSELGYLVITAVDGIDAVEKFMTHKESIKLLIFDVQMQGKSGLQAYNDIKQISPEIRMLFISGFNVEQFTGNLELGAGTELLSKPFNPNELADKIRKLLDTPTAVNEKEIL